METLEQLAGTLESLDALRSIVRTMKALAAASIRQYEQAVDSLTQYSRTVDMGLHVVLRDRPAGSIPEPRPGGGLGVVIFGSDHGLCGRFNEELAGFVAEHLRARGAQGRPRILAVGARVPPLLEEARLRVDRSLAAPSSAPAITATVNRVLLVIDGWMADEKVGVVRLFYSRRGAAARPHPVAQRLVPIDLHRLRRLEEAPWPSPVLPAFSMPRARLFAALARQYLFVTIFRAAAESQASEHASRLAAMQRAGKNLDERQQDLLGIFRRRRQETITAELLDLVAGYEATSTPLPTVSAGSKAPAPTAGRAPSRPTGAVP